MKSPIQIKRRNFIAHLTGLASLYALGGLSACSTFLASSASRRSPIHQPDEIHSEKGVLSVNPQVGFHPFEVLSWDENGSRLPSIHLNNRTYLVKGKPMIPGPTLRVKPGDEIRMRIDNHLPGNRNPEPPDDPNQPHHENTTNIHTHGLHVSPNSPGDNIFLAISPKGEKPADRPHSVEGRYDYVFKIPKDHPRGTFWYHPHKHGSVQLQLQNGMAGALIVEDDDSAPKEILQATDRVFIIQKLQRSPDNLFNHMTAVNGMLNPTIQINQGETQRWRFINASATDYIYLGLDGLDLNLIAVDGIYLKKMKTIDKLLLTPGNRADFLIQGKGKARTLKLRDQRSNKVLAIVRLKESSLTPTRLPERLPELPVSLRDISDGEIGFQREVAFDDVDCDGNDGYYVNRKKYDPDRLDQVMKLGDAEEWTIRNNTPRSHPFHIHVNPFQIIEINGEKLKEPIWRDTVDIPKKGYLKMRTRLLDFEGRFVLHCHNIPHEEKGMMQLVAVVKDKASSDRAGCFSKP
ncbi:MAG: multicopper oxidase family protein [Deltaproteobacteria bacterium]|nr:multicopper oxidase family protein [Deltaproteobacteria bacterium]